MSQYLTAARKYANDVTGGKIVACRYVKLACERFLKDMKGSDEWRMDVRQAEKVCGFVELLPHTKAKWARQKELIKLEPWQCFVLCSVFGWVSEETGLRRYRRVYIEVPRKNGKSVLSAAIGLYMLVEDAEEGAEIYSGASTEKQAFEVFTPARLMVLKTPGLRSHYGIEVGAKNLHVPSTASRFEPVIGKPGDGASPSCAIVDEFHQHLTSESYDTMATGMLAREQPLLWTITTAGSDTAGACYALRTQVTDSLEGKVEHDELFGIIYTVDANVEWSSEKALKMANPNLGVSVFADDLRTAQLRAVKSPREQSIFKTKHLCVWVTSAAPYFNADRWNQLGDAQVAEFLGLPVAIGVDLAQTQDIAGYVKLFKREIDGKAHYYVFPKFYLPEARAEEAQGRHYAQWAQQGWLTLTPGNSTDYTAIETDIKLDAERFPLTRLGFDPYNAKGLTDRLASHFGNDKVIQVGQNVGNLSFPMKQIAAAIDDGLIHHDGNPAMSWMMGNVTARPDRNENVFPRKPDGAEDRKIDGAVMLIVAMNNAVSAFEPPREPQIHFLSWEGRSAGSSRW